MEHYENSTKDMVISTYFFMYLKIIFFYSKVDFKFILCYI